jgi:1,4-alpha-glucan branching enzyme
MRLQLLGRAARGLPRAGTYRLILNTDSSYYFGSDALQLESVEAEQSEWYSLPFSAAVDLPPLTTLYFEAPKRANSNAGESTGESAASGTSNGVAPVMTVAGETSSNESAALTGAKRARRTSASTAAKRASRKSKE